jgi:hypothetical protein
MTDHYVTYTAQLVNGEKHPRRTGPLGEEAANALARELARKDSISRVVVEVWRMAEAKEVKA